MFFIVGDEYCRVPVTERKDRLGCTKDPKLEASESERETYFMNMEKSAVELDEEIEKFGDIIKEDLTEIGFLSFFFVAHFFPRGLDTTFSNILVTSPFTVPIVDTYQNLTTKLKHALSWASDRPSKFILKCDDDSFALVKKAAYWLDQNAKLPYWYMGNIQERRVTRIGPGLDQFFFFSKKIIFNF